ncbi:MAG: tetratricopeptide repeat protein [Bacteroidota bacterium]
MLRALSLSLFLAAGAVAQAPLDRARALYASGDTPGALAMLIDSGDLGPEAALLAARLSLDLGRPLDAVEVLAGIDTTDAPAQLLLGRSLEALGDFRAAEAAYARSVRADSSEAATSALAALVVRRSPAEAIPLYIALVARDSMNPASLGALGRALAQTDSSHLAVPVLRRAFRLYPRDEATALALARVYRGTAMLPAHLDEALRALPASAPLWRLDGADRMRRGMLGRAVDAYRTVIALDDSTASNLRDLGIALFYDGQTAEALTVLRQSIARDSADATALRVGGFAAHAEGETKEALDLLDAAAEALGRRALSDLAEETARVFITAQQDEEAFRQIDLAEALTPERATVILNRAMLQQQVGRLALALASFREFVERAGPEAAQYVPLAESRIVILENIERQRVEDDLRRRLNE